MQTHHSQLAFQINNILIFYDVFFPVSYENKGVSFLCKHLQCILDMARQPYLEIVFQQIAESVHFITLKAKLNKLCKKDNQCFAMESSNLSSNFQSVICSHIDV